MKGKVFRWISIFLGALFLSALFAGPIFAQLQPQKTTPGEPLKRLAPTEKPQPSGPQKQGVQSAPSKREPIRVQIKPELIKINKRPAIPFKPFTYSEFKDPQTGQMLKPDQLVTLSHLKPPKQIRGDQFISELNRLERDFNQYGYTYRDRGEIVIGEMAIRKDLLKTQANRIMSKTKKFSPSKVPQPLDAQAFERMYKENMGQSQVLSTELKKAFQTKSSASTKVSSPGKKTVATEKAAPPSLGPPEFKPIHQEKHWNESYGDPDLYAIHQNIDMILDGQKEKLTMMANNEIGITIFNTKFTIVGGTANLSAPGPDATDSNVQGDFHVKYLGTVKKQVTIGPASNQPYSGYVPIIEVPEVSTTLPVPTPVSVGIGYAGTIGINYNFSVTPLAINCQIVPVAHLLQTVNFGFGVGIPGIWNIYEVGYEGQLLFLTDRPTLLGELSVKPKSLPAVTGKPTVAKPGEVGPPGETFTFRAVATCFDNFTALRGSFYITFTVDLIFWEKTWKFLIYKDDGLQHLDFLFDETLTQSVFI
jgi:hypothetical protein